MVSLPRSITGVGFILTSTESFTRHPFFSAFTQYHPAFVALRVLLWLKSFHTKSAVSMCVSSRMLELLHMMVSFPRLTGTRLMFTKMLSRAAQRPCDTITVYLPL